MNIRMNLFVKMLLLVIAVITITLLLFGRSYQNDIRVITKQLTLTDMNHLQFFAQQLDNRVDQLFTSAHTLFRDPTIRDFGQIDRLKHLIDRNQTILNVLEKLSLQTSSINLTNKITIYNVQSQEALSSDSSSYFDESLLTQPLDLGWTFIPSPTLSDTKGEFRIFLSNPTEFADTPQLATMIMEVRFPSSDLQKMLGDYQMQYSGDTFLYHKDAGLVYQAGADLNLAMGMLDKLKDLTEKNNSSTIVNYEGKRYIVNSAWSSSLNWHIIHYLPLEQFLKPLESSRTAFYTASLIIVMLGITFSLLLFRQIQRPISMLLRAVNRLKEGQWSYRISLNTNNEFAVLNGAFNEMASQIQMLIERVYMEELRVKDAYLKQLQSQINPHFLYNCLFFIKSKASVGDTEAVAAMAINLGEYYRYITRLDNSNTTIKEELKLLNNYLSVQNLRKQRIDYRIDMPDSLLEERIPRLLIQPLVENSIVHGIEKKSGKGIIRIRGEFEGTTLFIIVEDNGAGMSETKIAELLAKLESSSLDEASGYGLWNVQQRLKQQFGAFSGLNIQTSHMGGVCITLRIDRKGD